MSFAIDGIDHVVLNCTDVEVTASWYTRALGMKREAFGPERRLALRFGDQKINLRPTRAANWETSAVDAPGSLDVCFVSTADPSAVIDHLRACSIITAGPVQRTGALGPITSVYCRDPDGNLVEIASYSRRGARDPQNGGR